MTKQDAGVGDDNLKAVLRRIDELGPVIAGDAAKAEELGHLTDAVVDGLRGAKATAELSPRTGSGVPASSGPSSRLISAAST